MGIEGPKSSERPPLTRERVVDALKASEPGDLKAMTILREWLDSEQPESTRGTPSDDMERDIALAELYRDGGWAEAAIDAYRNALTQERELGSPRYWDCVDELEKLGGTPIE